MTIVDGLSPVKEAVARLAARAERLLGKSTDRVEAVPLNSLRPVESPPRRPCHGGYRNVHGPSSEATLRANELTRAKLRESGQRLPTAKKLAVADQPPRPA
jgi:hypothetical protein